VTIEINSIFREGFVPATLLLFTAKDGNKEGCRLGTKDRKYRIFLALSF